MYFQLAPHNLIFIFKKIFILQNKSLYSNPHIDKARVNLYFKVFYMS